jgi:hypothetical protein
MNTVKIMEKLMTYVNNQTTEWSVKIMMTMLKLCNTPFFKVRYGQFSNRNQVVNTHNIPIDKS